ncbi:hypothetical protein Nepgr_002405 [Nepenthes gracilis]|uniref:RNA uridylyltransferase n=1 Tax=Nepenthes gracilis TaxID=150966 RepID=A0AAD3P674_NEPGR|nr:hypothetical protein Nepgr_002405 [Nepenthes gracilis]
MTGGCEEPSSPLPPQPPVNGGEFLLRLVQNRHQQSPTPAPPFPAPRPHNLSLDPAVAAVGPTIPTPMDSNLDHPSLPSQPPWRHALPHPNNSPSPPYTPNLFHNGSSHQPSPTLGGPHQQFNLYHHQYHQQDRSKLLFGNMPFHVPSEGLVSSNFLDDSIRSNDSSSKAKFTFVEERESGKNLSNRTDTGFSDPDLGIDLLRKLEIRGQIGVHGSPEMKRLSPPPGFPGKSMDRRKNIENNTGRETGTSSGLSRRGFSSNKNHDNDKRFSRGDNDTYRFIGSGEIGIAGQLKSAGSLTGSTIHPVSASDIEESSLHLQSVVVETVGRPRDWIRDDFQNSDHVSRRGANENGDLSDQLADSSVAEDESNKKNYGKIHRHRDKDFRSDARGQWLLPHRMRNFKRLMECRTDIERLNAPFLAIYESLIPPEEEKEKQKQLLTSLEKLVCKEWPDARLYIYGSCANSFGFSKSDIDVCIAIDQDINKSEVLLELADIFQSDNLQNVQALTRARVPIVKLKDPVTGISCDICINNVLAVVNTKLLRDYAQIDVRLRQLAFIVKHWAKSRAVNETYQGTLSSYAYVLMCIHFLQQRKPAILPCLQGMETTYAVTVEEVECTYFDQVEKLRDFGARNKETIAQLVWAFFNYWAYSHDYTNSVISVRTGSILSKQSKDWTRRIGNDRHLICIEDPFETSHDLGRVVDKYSIRVLREEFERAAEIMQRDPDPCTALFKPYVPS